MLITRREWLRIAAVSPIAPFAASTDRQQSWYDRYALGRVSRIRRLIEAYEQQGIHRTGTDVDRRSADWLAAEVRRTGLKAAREPFLVNRVDPVAASLVAHGRRIDGVPLFDAGFTGATGVRGRLGPLASDTDIGLTSAAPNTAAVGPLGEARRKNRHTAIVCVTRGGRPGLCPSNADQFLDPFGPPVLQVSSDEAGWLDDCARQGVEVHVTAHVQRTAVEAFNVVATLDGFEPSLPPFIVMTPRSGWWTCASERGGGIACWLELMRALKSQSPQLRTRKGPMVHDFVFVASSGHELGHLGINAFVDRRPGIVAKSAGWMHLGANIGAAQDPGSVIQASDDAFEKELADRMAVEGVGITRRNPRGTVPGGEAEVVHRGGGRYLSVIGRSALFHNPADRGPDAIDAAAISTFVDVFIGVAMDWAGNKL
jgi:hypothetical protein